MTVIITYLFTELKDGRYFADAGLRAATPAIGFVL